MSPSLPPSCATLHEAYRWSLAQTLRAARRACRRGRPAPRVNLERLFLRRWFQAVTHSKLPDTFAAGEPWHRAGKAMIRTIEHHRLRRKRS